MTIVFSHILFSPKKSKQKFQNKIKTAKNMPFFVFRFFYLQTRNEITIRYPFSDFGFGFKNGYGMEE